MRRIQEFMRKWYFFLNKLMKKILATKWNISHLMSCWCSQTVLETEETGWSKTFKWITQRLGGSSVFSIYFYFPPSDDFLFHLHFYWTSAYREISCRVESIGSSLRLDNILGRNRDLVSLGSAGTSTSQLGQK